MGCDFHDEVSVQGGADPIQQWDRWHDPTSFQPGQGRLCHARSVGGFDLRQAEGESALADGLADEEGLAVSGEWVAIEC